MCIKSWRGKREIVPVGHNSKKFKQRISQVISQMQVLQKLAVLPKEGSNRKETYPIADTSQSCYLKCIPPWNCYCVPTWTLLTVFPNFLKPSSIPQLPNSVFPSQRWQVLWHFGSSVPLTTASCTLRIYEYQTHPPSLLWVEEWAPLSIKNTLV